VQRSSHNVIGIENRWQLTHHTTRTQHREKWHEIAYTDNMHNYVWYGIIVGWASHNKTVPIRN